MKEMIVDKKETKWDKATIFFTKKVDGVSFLE